MAHISRKTTEMGGNLYSGVMRVGLIGFGFAGRVFHANVIEAVEGLELAAIVQRTGDSAGVAFPHVRVVPTVEEMLADPTIRLVVVATPNATHLPIARQCLLAGRDVVIDKPFALSSAEAASLIQLARAQGRMLSVYQNRRWDGDFLTVKKMLEEDRLGEVVLFESHYDRYRQLPRLHAWREDGSAGGGVLFDLGAHLVDQALVLFGIPHNVWASVRKERAGARSDDAFDLYLSYGEHARVRVWLRATCLARSPGARFTVNGTAGTFRKFGLDPQEALLIAGDRFSSRPWGTEGPEHWGTLTLDEGGEAVSTPVATEAGDYRGYYQNVRDALHGGALEVTPLQAWRTMRVLEMALASSASGSTVDCAWGPEP